MSVGLRGLRLVVLIALSLWAVVNWFHLVEGVLQGYSPLPYWDYWRVVTEVDDFKAFHLGVFWHQHNDHRIVFPHLVFAADMLFGHGLQVLPLTISFLCYLGTWLIIAWTLLSDLTIDLTFRLVMLLVAAILMGWPGAVAVLGIPFLLQWTMLEFVVMLSFALLSRVGRGSDSGCLAGSIVCAVVANYCSANGLLMWPMLLSIAFLLRLSRRQVAILSGSAIASVGLFFFRYNSSGDLNLLNFVLYPAHWIGFLASYLSVPFGYMGHRQVGVIFGFVFALAFAVELFIALRRDLLRSSLGIVLLGTCMFSLLSALMVSSARMDPSDRSFVMAKPSRYLMIPIVNWATVFSAGIWIALRLQRVRWACTIVFLVLILFVVTFNKTEVWVTARQAEFSIRQICALSLDSGLRDPEWMRMAYPDAQFVGRYLPVLERYQLSIYFLPYAHWLMQPANYILKERSEIASDGKVTGVSRIAGGFQVSGRSENVHSTSASPGVVLVNDLGQIVGFGSKAPGGYPAYVNLVKNILPTGWVGFVRDTPGAKFVTAFSFDRGAKPSFRICDPIAVSVHP